MFMKTRLKHIREWMAERLLKFKEVFAPRLGGVGGLMDKDKGVL